MSVVIKDSNDAMRAFVKGSPEKIEELCFKESLPFDYNIIL